MATKANVLKVMKIDKEELIRTVNNKKSSVMSDGDILKKYLNKSLNGIIDTKIISFSYSSSSFTENMFSEEIWNEIKYTRKIREEEEISKRNMKSKIEEEFKKLEREILLEGAGIAAEMLKDVLTKLREEVNNV